MVISVKQNAHFGRITFNTNQSTNMRHFPSAQRLPMVHLRFAILGVPKISALAVSFSFSIRFCGAVCPDEIIANTSNKTP